MSNEIRLKFDFISYTAIFIILLILCKFDFLAFLWLFFVPGICILFLWGKDIIKYFFTAFPLSFLVTVFPIYYLTRLQIAVPHQLIFFIPLVFLIVSYIKIRYLKIKFILEKANQSKIFYLILTLIIILTFIIYNPLIYRDAIPLTTSSMYLHAAELIHNSLLTENKVPVWDKYFFSGGQFLYGRSFLLASLPAFTSLLSGSPVYKNLNLVNFFLIVLVILCYYNLLNALSNKKLINLVLSFFVIITPKFYTDIFNNALKAADIFYLILVLYLIIKFIDNKREPELLGITIAMWIMTNYTVFYVISFSIAIIFLVNLMFSNNKKDFIKDILKIAAPVILICSCWWLPYLFYNKYIPIEYPEADWQKPLSSLKEFFIKAAALSYTDNFNEMSYTSMTPFLFFGGLLSINFLLFKFKFNDKKIVAIFILIISQILFIISEIYHFDYLIPFRPYLRGLFVITFSPLPLIFICALSLGLSTLVDIIPQNKKKNALIVIVIILFLVEVPSVYFAKKSVSNYITETAMVSDASFKDIYNVVANFPGDGRFIEYGIFGPAIIPAIVKWTNKSAASGYEFQMLATKRYYENIIYMQEASFDYLQKNASPQKVFDLYKKYHVKLVIMNLCSLNGYDAFKRSVQPMPENYSLYYNNSCIFILLPILNSSFIEQGGIGLNYKRESNIIYMNSISNESIIVKEGYFPKWHAYQNGEKLKVTMTDEGLISIENSSPGIVELRLDNSLPEYISFVMAMIYLIFLTILIIYKNLNIRLNEG